MKSVCKGCAEILGNSGSKLPNISSEVSAPHWSVLRDVFFSHSQRVPESITPNLAFIPRNFYYRMGRDEGCLRLQTRLLLPVFSGSPFPAWGSDLSSSEGAPPPPSPPPSSSSSLCSHRSFHVNENAVFLLLYQMTRKCVTLTLEDKLSPRLPKFLQSAS